MKDNYNTDNYSKYGKIDNNINITSYFSDEFSKLNDGEITQFYCKNEETWHGYLFTSRMCYFPLSFQQKHFRLWKWHEEMYALKFICSVERGKEYESNFWYFGVAEFVINNFDTVLSIVEKDYMNSFVLFSKKQQNLDELLESYIPKTMQGVNYVEVINSECRKNNDVVTIVVGNDGTNINCFRSIDASCKK